MMLAGIAEPELTDRLSKTIIIQYIRIHGKVTGIPCSELKRGIYRGFSYVFPLTANSDMERKQMK